MGVDTMDIKTYLPLFIDETKENIQQMSENLLILEKNHNDIEAINEIFRAIHTIKGMSATMGFEDISTLAHEAENLLDEVRHNQVQIRPQTINGFFQVIDEFEAQLVALEQSGEPQKINSERIEHIVSMFNRKSNGSQSEDIYHLEIYFSKDCVLRPARAMIICNQLASVGNLIKTEPPEITLPKLDSLDKLECLISTGNPQKVRAILEDGVEIESYIFESQTSEESVIKSPEAHLIKNTATIRVDTDKLDYLLNLVSELVINKTSIQQAATLHPNLADGVEHLHRLTGDLQTIVMNMRMIPLDTVFNRFPRMVRDTAMTLNKSVDLEIQGAETELDRTIIDDIADPLLHLIRNSVDHGIESVPERTRLGKPITGKITLRAFQTGNLVIIDVIDDGYGLDLDKIRSKAKAMGLWSGVELENNELINFIFTTGFTTSESVTDLSGRGVGLDVVKKSIESLGGVIEVFSKKGTGTTFRISLPLTLAIIQGLLVKCGHEIFVIPLSYVRETDIIYPRDVQTIGQQQIVMLRGKVLPIVFLSNLVDSKDSPVLEEMSLVVVKFGDKEVGIVVDDLLAQQEIVIKNVNWGERFFRSFLGTTILGDGSVVLILDINALLLVVKAREGK